MYLMEGFLQAEWCDFWYAYSLPVVAYKVEIKIKIINNIKKYIDKA